jgi:hypothetical protein
LTLTPNPAFAYKYLTKTIKPNWAQFIALNGIPTFSSGFIPA